MKKEKTLVIQINNIQNNKYPKSEKEDIAKLKKSYTGQYLNKILK